MANVGILKAKVATPSSPQTFCNIAFEVDFGRKAVRVYCAAGTTEEFQAYDMAGNFKAFQDWAEEVRYYGRVDNRVTADIERHLNHLAADGDFGGKLMDTIQRGEVSHVEYAIMSGLEHILGSKQLSVQFHMSSGAEAAPEPSTSGPAPDAAPPAVPMQLVMAPINGVPLVRLRIGARLMAKFADLKHPQTKAYLSRLDDAEAKNPTAQEVVLQELREAPEAGGDAVRAIVELPGGMRGEVVEENRYIRVRLAAEPEAPRRRARPQGPHSSSIHPLGLPIPVLAGVATFLLVLIGFILFMIS